MLEAAKPALSSLPLEITVFQSQRQLPKAMMNKFGYPVSNILGWHEILNHARSVILNTTHFYELCINDKDEISIEIYK